MQRCRTAYLLTIIQVLLLSSTSFTFRFRGSKHVVPFRRRQPSAIWQAADDDSGEHTSEGKRTSVKVLARRDFVATTTCSAFLGLFNGAMMPMCAAAAVNSNKGVVLPSEGEIEAAIPHAWDDLDNPFQDLGGGGSSMFARLDTSPDSLFYSEPRFVEHVDDSAVSKMKSYISDRLLKEGDSVLDLCSSWTSHIDVSTRDALQLRRVAGLGMNEKELAANPVLTDFSVRDLNSNPKLPYEDDSFDLVLCQLSIDYLTKPLAVIRECARVLRSGGQIAVLFSNRLFLSKAVGLWTGADDVDHAYTVACYLHYSDVGFGQIHAEDLSTRKGRGKDRPVVGDPLYVVTAEKGDIPTT